MRILKGATSCPKSQSRAKVGAPPSSGARRKSAFSWGRAPSSDTVQGVASGWLGAPACRLPAQGRPHPVPGQGSPRQGQRRVSRAFHEAVAASELLPKDPVGWPHGEGWVPGSNAAGGGPPTPLPPAWLINPVLASRAGARGSIGPTIRAGAGSLGQPPGSTLQQTPSYSPPQRPRHPSLLQAALRSKASSPPARTQLFLLPQGWLGPEAGVARPQLKGTAVMSLLGSGWRDAGAGVGEAGSVRTTYAKIFLFGPTSPQGGTQPPHTVDRKQAEQGGWCPETTAHQRQAGNRPRAAGPCSDLPSPPCSSPGRCSGNLCWVNKRVCLLVHVRAGEGLSFSWLWPSSTSEKHLVMKPQDC